MRTTDQPPAPIPLRTALAVMVGVAGALMWVTRVHSLPLPQETLGVDFRQVPMPSSAFPGVVNALQRVFGDGGSLSKIDDRSLVISHTTQVAKITFYAEGKIGLNGSVELCHALESLLGALQPDPGGQPVQVLPLNSNGQATLVQFAMARRADAGPGSAAGQAGYGPTHSTLPQFLGIRTIRPAAFQQTGNLDGDDDSNPMQTPSGQAAATGQVNPNESVSSDTLPHSAPANPSGQDAASPDSRLEGSLPLQQFEDVQVEILPEIDAIILRGREQQLSDLSEIIKRLDEASRQAQPQMEMVLLQHASSRGLSQLIEENQENLIGVRQGRVSLSPLDQPNAILLIGWGEAFTLVRDLIHQLDQPAQANSQFEVIQLKHAIARDIQTQIQDFYSNRDGLAPVIQTTVDERTNAIIVHAAANDLNEVRSLVARLDVARAGAMQQARVFPIRNSLATDVAQALGQALAASNSTGPATSMQLLDQQGQPLVTSGILGASNITVNERNNSILVSAAPENLTLIEQLIGQLDTPGMLAKIKIFPIYNGDAGTLVETLRSLIPNQAPGASGSAQMSSAADESSLVPLRFTVDARGNNVIAVGSDGDLKIVEALIVRLDESDASQRKSTVYQLKNSPAVDVALAINEFLRSKRQVEQATPGTNNPFEQLEKEVVVVPEPVQNKLILSATPRYYDEVLQLIQQLDEQPPQVMIQVMIAEVALGNTDEFGVEFGLQNSVLFDRSLLGDLVTRTTTRTNSTPAGVVTETIEEIVAASNLPGFVFNTTDQLGNSGATTALTKASQVGGQGISNFSVGRSNNELGFGGLVLSASSENVSFLLRALQDSRRLEVLSRPQVLTLDNQQAFIQVGQRVPRIVNSIINQNGAQNNIELENVGLIVGVTPRISPDGNVVMEIDAEKSSLGPEDEGIPVSISADGTVIRSPRVDTITAQATVSAADGETIILGGLISRKTRTNHRTVPWLGRIPVLKNLFRYDLFDLQRVELMIIMTPHVVRSQQDMERLKQAEFARISWCEADIFDIHGDVHSPQMLSPMLISEDDWDASEANVVYPDVDPRGLPEPAVAEADPFRPGGFPFSPEPAAAYPPNSPGPGPEPFPNLSVPEQIPAAPKSVPAQSPPMSSQAVPQTSGGDKTSRVNHSILPAVGEVTAAPATYRPAFDVSGLPTVTNDFSVQPVGAVGNTTIRLGSMQAPGISSPAGIAGGR